MQPHPVSDEKPCGSLNVFLTRIVNDIVDMARGSVDLAIGSKPVRYVIQTRDSKSSRKSEGHPPSWPGPSEDKVESKLLVAELGGVSGGCGGGRGGRSSVGSEGGVEAEVAGTRSRFLISRVYGHPRHQAGSLASLSFVGSGSHSFCTMRRLTRPRSAACVMAASMATAKGKATDPRPEV